MSGKVKQAGKPTHDPTPSAKDAFEQLTALNKILAALDLAISALEQETLFNDNPACAQLAVSYIVNKITPVLWLAYESLQDLQHAAQAAAEA